MLLEAAAYWWQPEAHGSIWMAVGSGNQVLWRSTFIEILKHFLSFFVIGRTFIRSEQSFTRSGNF
jgi:hypothetical protein